MANAQERSASAELPVHLVHEKEEVTPKQDTAKARAHPFELMPHQKKAVAAMKNGCILKGGVGTGKTVTSLAYYVEREAPRDIYVITTAKKRDSGDWSAEGRLLGVFPEVDSWNNLAGYEDVEGAFFIFDEQRVVGSGGWAKSFQAITKRNHWVLLSATPGDTWMDYIPVFVANGFYKNRTEFCREHVMFSRFAKYPKVDRYLRTQVLAAHLRSILVEMPFEKHTHRNDIDVFVEYDRDLFMKVWGKRWNYIKERPIRDIAECFSLMRRVINSSPDRVRAVKDLLINHPRVIIFYNFDYELQLLLEGLDLPVSQWNGHNHDPLPEGDEWAYLVQYAAGAEGWNCTTTDTTIFYSPSYSYRMSEQAKGRIDRLDTQFKELYYYHLKSSCWLDRAIFKAVEEKKNFNEKAVLKDAIW